LAQFFLAFYSFKNEKLGFNGTEIDGGGSEPNPHPNNHRNQLPNQTSF
jgi:hypothetical protein